MNIPVNIIITHQASSINQREGEEAVKYGEEKKQYQSSPVFNKAEVAHDFLASRHTHLYCLFLKAVIPLFGKANILQKDAPKVHLLHAILTEQLPDILTKFLKPTATVDEDFKSHPVHMLSYKQKTQQKSDENLFTVVETKNYLEANASKLRLKEFYCR